MRTGDRRWRSFTKTSWPSAAMRWKPSTLPTGISSWHLSREERKYFWVIQSGPGSGKWSRCTHTLWDDKLWVLSSLSWGCWSAAAVTPWSPEACGNKYEATVAIRERRDRGVKEITTQTSWYELEGRVFESRHWPRFFSALEICYSDRLLWNK